jgi:membrane protease YdiL (CAAX protease family)
MQELARPTVTKSSLLLEVVIVMWVSLGASAVRALLAFAERLNSEVPLSDQTATIIAPIVATPWLDVLYQFAGIVLPLGAVALVVYLLHASGESLADIGVDRTQPARDLLRGGALAVAIGVGGLIFYIVGVRLGLGVQIAASTLPGNWYDIPILLLRAAESALLEEIVVLGYFLHRMTQLGVSKPWAVTISAILRGTYHLYQGIGGFVGNLIMGIIFGWLFYKWRRAGPMIVAHFLIDAAAFVGYALMADKLGWLPTGR